MKKNVSWLIVSLTLIWTVQIQAQEETLFDNLNVHGGFGGPILEIGLGDNISTAVGGGGGVLIGDFFFGGYGMGNTQNNIFDNDGNREELDLGHGGLWLGFYAPSDNIIHFYGSTRFGFGDIDNAEDEGIFTEIDDNVFVLTPEAGLEVNIAPWFRLVGTVGYRWVTGTEDNLFYSDDDFSGAFAGLTFRFGGAF